MSAPGAVTRRRQRRPDPLASPEAVRAVLNRLRAAMPDLIPAAEKELLAMLRAARHAERYPATDTRRGRPSRFRRADLLTVSARLGVELARGTSGRTLSVASFVDHYLRVLRFPSDVVEALGRGDVNLFEAEQLARVTAKRLGVTARRAEKYRAGLLEAHLRANLSGSRLRTRVEELVAGATSERPHEAGWGLDGADLEDFDPHDTTHLFWEEIKHLGFAFAGIRREDVTEHDLEELQRACKPLWEVISRIERRKKRVTGSRLSFGL
jgi:hypothetical protein